MGWVTGVVYEHECQKEGIEKLFNAYSGINAAEYKFPMQRANMNIQMKVEHTLETQRASREKRLNRNKTHHYRNYKLQEKGGTLWLPFAYANFPSEKEAKRFRGYLEENMNGTFFGPRET